MIRFCPSCHTERPLEELYCQGLLDEVPCNWDLSSILVTESGRVAAGPGPVIVSGPVCANGHLVSVGDLICPQCGADLTPITGSAPTVIAGWEQGRVLPSTSRVRERFVVARQADGLKAVMTLYSPGYEPDPSVYNVLRGLSRDHVPDILETGRWEGRAYEVNEELTGGTLAELGLLPSDTATLSRVVSEVGSALHSFSERGLRHRDLRPGAILVRQRDPLDLVITSFGSGRLSDFDLDIVSPLETTRYTAPEAIAGGVAAASDWWSLGIILLEQVTRGACFDGVNDQAFLIHVLTVGVTIPDGLDSRVALLLRGLLAKDRRERWMWSQVSGWLSGESPEAPESSTTRENQGPSGPAFVLGGRPYTSPTSLALAAADRSVWNEARDLLLRGALVTWAEQSNVDPQTCAWMRELGRLDGISDDFRLALALKRLNPAIPLICQGDIVTPGWLLDHPAEGHELIVGAVPDLLQRMDAEQWLARLKARAIAVRERARQLDIVLYEDDLRVHLLSTSRSRLAALWTERRKLLPDTDHPALLAIAERRLTTEEDLILLLSASVGQFRTQGELLEEAAAEASRAGVPTFDPSQAAANLQRSRSDLQASLEQRVAGFVRCGNDRVDEWVDQFRLERRLSLPRTLVVLAIPTESWREPPKQAYVATLLDFFAKRVAGAVQRGPLSRMIIGKTTARVDITEYGTDLAPADALLNRLLLRSDHIVDVDPTVFRRSDTLERRTRLLDNNATLYRRDTGIDGLYLGFPFVLMQEDRAGVRPRIAPVLLWPIRIRPEVGASGRVSLVFDRNREEVRLNPAFEALFGSQAAQRWQLVARELLQRASVTTPDVMDAFGTLLTPVGRSLVPLPRRDARMRAPEGQLWCSAVLFHLAYAGQAIVEDLRQLKGIPPTGTALETALRVVEPPLLGPTPLIQESERFFTAASDPSQESAVFEARRATGLVIEGPPGTGKSQTIVNMVADAIGRGRTVLVVCQKQPALEVVRKRLAAEGFGGRLVMVTDVNADRGPVVRDIRDQLARLAGIPLGTDQAARRRTQVAARLESVKAELDAHHAALHMEDPTTTLSYRAVLGELLAIEQSRPPPINAPALRSLIADDTIPGLVSIEEECAPLARYWLPAKAEDSPLAVLRVFSADRDTVATYRLLFDKVASAELQRQMVLARTSSAVRIEHSAEARAWLTRYVDAFRGLSSQERSRLARWLPMFLEPPSESQGDTLIAEIASARAWLASQRDVDDESCRKIVSRFDERQLLEWRQLAEELTRPASFIGQLSPARWLKRYRLGRFLRRNEIAAVTFQQFLSILVHETELRPWRERLSAIARTLLQDPTDLEAQPRGELLALSATLWAHLDQVQSVVALVKTCPQREMLVEALFAADREAFDSFSTSVEQGCEREGARSRSRNALAAASSYLMDDWRQYLSESIEGDVARASDVTRVADAFPTLVPYQMFRARSARLTQRGWAAFQILRQYEEALGKVYEADLDATVRNTIRREARLAWKMRFEMERPVLLLDRSELAAKQTALADLDAEFRKTNRKVLIDGVNIDGLGSAREWEDVTRLTGQRARRLREVLDRGVDLGLMKLRPVWLMNPDIVSRVLPLKPGLFDTVIFDEASQMPVEHALPSLYRCRSMVISGDEKQMPPTSFFSSRLESDEEDAVDAEEFEDQLTDEARGQLAEKWNRREIKDCPDLLELAKSILPTTTLQIHYRSSYRELVAFSNAAFYKDQLNIPVRHPDDEVRRVRPIEVVRADGVYQNQTNPKEADFVVEQLAKLWSVAPTERRSVGVVTFNRKQADLIEEKLEVRAEGSASFRQALAAERDRIEDGEDMGFFVKNVENVQGDERDVIIFSSTFGRNGQGTFRRNFGVLGQVGGERRLNVAVTRAREKVVLITSMPISEISDLLGTSRSPTSARDFLQAYFEYARATSAGELDVSRGLLSRLNNNHNSSPHTMSLESDGFVDNVMEFVATLGWRAVPLKDAGAFGLDLAIEDPRSGLYGVGIECDAPRHPLLADARARELWRPTLLARSIHRVHRVSSYGWYHQRDAEQRLLKTAIEQALS